MHIIHSDKSRNRLYLTLSGVISLSEAEQVKEEIFKEVEQLRPGFDVVNNLSKYIQGDERAAPVLQGVEKFFLEHNVKRVVRVVGTSKTGLMQFAKFSQLKENGNIHYFPTMNEAEKFLDRG